MTRTHKANRVENYMPGYSIHDPNQQELAQLELAKRFDRLKKLLTALQHDGK
jgi:hypothetical protein